MQKIANGEETYMNRKTLIFITFFSFLFCTLVFAQNNEDVEGKRISIRFYTKSVYYPGGEGSEPIFVKVSITNNSADVMRFKLADDRSFSMDFSLLNTRNQEIAHNEGWKRKRAANGHIYFREISLEQGETYSFVENIKTYLDIENAGVYVIKALFFPELKKLPDNTEAHLVSNALTLEIKPSPHALALGTLPVSEATAEILKPQAIPPDQVINYMLIARQKSLWQQFFLYMDVDRMISKDSARGRKFQAESEMGRLNMIEVYKRDLSRSHIDKDIAAIPIEFKIEHTAYTSTEAQVKVIEWFQYRNFREKKRFTYYLSSRDGIWMLYDYLVENLGTE